MGLGLGFGLRCRVGRRLVAAPAGHCLVAGSRGVGGGGYAGAAQWSVAVAAPAAIGTLGAGPGGRLSGRVAGHEPCAQHRHQLHPVCVLPGLGGRHRRLFRRTALWQAQARARHQPGQELGRGLQRHGWRVPSGTGLVRAGIAIQRRQPQPVRTAAGPTRPDRRPGGAGLPGWHERGRRPGRVAGQARCRSQGFEPAVRPAMAACSTESMPCCRCSRCRWRCSACSGDAAHAASATRHSRFNRLHWHQHAGRGLAPSRTLFGAGPGARNSASTSSSPSACAGGRAGRWCPTNPARAWCAMQCASTAGRRRCSAAPRHCATWRRIPRSTASWRPSSAPPGCRPPWRRSKPAGAWGWPTRNRWSSPVIWCTRRGARRGHDPADRQRAQRDLPMPAGPVA